jgi:hypothetical protein
MFTKKRVDKVAKFIVKSRIDEVMILIEERIKVEVELEVKLKRKDKEDLVFFLVSSYNRVTATLMLSLAVFNA